MRRIARLHPIAFPCSIPFRILCGDNDCVSSLVTRSADCILNFIMDYTCRKRRRLEAPNSQDTVATWEQPIGLATQTTTLGSSVPNQYALAGNEYSNSHLQGVTWPSENWEFKSTHHPIYFLPEGCPTEANTIAEGSCLAYGQANWQGAPGCSASQYMAVTGACDASYLQVNSYISCEAYNQNAFHQGIPNSSGGSTSHQRINENEDLEKVQPDGGISQPLVQQHEEASSSQSLVCYGMVRSNIPSYFPFYLLKLGLYLGIRFSRQVHQSDYRATATTTG